MTTATGQSVDGMPDREARMATPSDTLARGRRLMCVSMYMLGGGLVSLVGFMAAGYVAATAGWIVEDDLTMVFIGLTVAVGFIVAVRPEASAPKRSGQTPPVIRCPSGSAASK